VNLATENVRQVRIEQRGKRTENAALGLPAQSKQDEIVSRKNRIHNLRHNRVVIPDNAREYLLLTTSAQSRDQVVAKFVFHTAASQRFFRERASA
jgi:hypothetical protein